MFTASRTTVDPEIKSYKLHRWYERLKEVENGEKA